MTECSTGQGRRLRATQARCPNQLRDQGNVKDVVVEPAPTEHKTGSQVPIPGTGTNSTADMVNSNRPARGPRQPQTQVEVVEETRCCCFTRRTRRKAPQATT
ncbi:hypothetical protein GBAR_LOCUS3826 [Geodia barretti]|uniref:Uncharacterized protein n=1 Tax=Geodia barretti TaxID=519541 RepID=A0AA35R5N4_GEOBA|nr:hypothetical protein GBAR_LOCUS3826 [Geodia barretti]